MAQIPGTFDPIEALNPIDKVIKPVEKKNDFPNPFEGKVGPKLGGTDDPPEGGLFDRPFPTGSKTPGEASNKFQDFQRNTQPADTGPPKPLSLDADVVSKSSTITPLPTTPKPQSLEPTKTTITPPEPIKKAEDTKKKEGEKTTDIELETQIQNIEQMALDNIEAVLKGEDPFAELQFNQTIQQLGPLNQAASDALTLQLKGKGIFGKNAGTAWMVNLARQQGVQTSDIIGKINYQSAQRLENMNRYGPELANSISQKRINRTVSKYDFGIRQIKDLVDFGETDPQAYTNLAASNGVNLSPEAAAFIAEQVGSENTLDNLQANRLINSNYRQIENDLQSLVPGLVIDGSAYNSLTPEQQQDVWSKTQQIEQAIASNDIAKAQSLIKELQSIYPNTVVGDYSNWNPRDFSSLENLDNLIAVKNKAKILVDSGDDFEAQQLLLNDWIDPTTVDAKFNDLWATTDPDTKAKLKEKAGIPDGEEPVTDEDKASILAWDEVDGMSTTTVEEIFESYFDNSPPEIKEWLLAPENADLTRAWIFNVISGPYEVDDNGLIVPVAGQQLPPWNSDSNDSHYFTDWSMADSYNKESDTLNVTYEGGNVYDDDDVFQRESQSYNDQMNTAWEAYKKTGDSDLTRQEWFDDVKPTWDGNTVTFNGEAQKREDLSEDPTLRFTQESINEFDSILNGSRNFNGLGDEKIFAATGPGGDPDAVQRMRDNGFKEISSSKLKSITDVNDLLKLMPVGKDGNPLPMVDKDGNPLEELEFVMLVDGRPFKVSRAPLSGDGSMEVYGVFLDEDPATRQEVTF